MLLDTFFAMVAESMESNSNASTSTINNSHNSNANSRKGDTMETASNNNSNASNSNSKGKGNGKRNSNSKGKGKANSKASAPKEASNSNASNSLPETLPETANAGISLKGMEQDAATSLLFQYHIRKGLEIYGGACSICQLYNFLRGDNPLRLEKDGSPKQDNLPRWRGLGSSKLFRANTQGTLLEYTNKVCSNGRIRSIVKAGPMLQDFSK